MKNKIVFGTIMVSIFMHIFCCGLPIILTIMSGLGIYIPILVEHNDHNLDIYIFAFSGLLLLLSFILYYKNKQKTCLCNECNPNKKIRNISKYMIIITSMIYIFNLLWHFYS